MPDATVVHTSSEPVSTLQEASAPSGKLQLSLAETLSVCDGEPWNLVELSGAVCKEPVYRKTPLGREICDIMLAVNRSYGRSDYLPCILWGNSARLGRDYAVGTQLLLTGRLQSRQYIKVLEDHSEERVAYEISVITSQVLTEETE